MKVTINERDYELKELTKEEAIEYIQKDVYVWDNDVNEPVKRKLLEVFRSGCDYPYCVLSLDEIGTNCYVHCAPVTEEWYVYEASDGHFFFHCDAYPDYKTVDHGSHDYCVQKARELNEQKEATKHPLTYYELTQLLKCFGVDLCYSKEVISNTIISYVVADENKALSDEYKIRYKQGEWMSATRETVWKWWGEEGPTSDISRFVSFMGWDEKKE